MNGIEGGRRSGRRIISVTAANAVLFFLTCPGCGDALLPAPAPLFTVGLKINGEPVGSAIVDTGGGYELMLRESIGLPILDEVEVLAFRGLETVGLTEGFAFTVDDISLTSEGALVGVSICDCNGVGYLFFRRTGRTLGIDFATLEAILLDGAPVAGVQIPFGHPPDSLPHFDSAFVTVKVSANGETLRLNGLLDTGTNATIMRRGLFTAQERASPPDRLDVTIERSELGVVAASVLLFDTPGLPDIVLGTDVMRAWSDRWYFTYTPRGGAVLVAPRGDESMADVRLPS